MKLLPITLAIALLGLTGNLHAAARRAHHKAKPGKVVRVHSRAVAQRAEVASSRETALALPETPKVAPAPEAHLEGMLPVHLDQASPELEQGSYTGGFIAKLRPILPGDAAPQSSDLTLALLDKAKTYLGTPYRYGGTTPKGFDCSGFVSFVFGSFGLRLEHSSASQARQGEPIALEQIQPGDLLFFRTRGQSRAISHVGIYLGAGRFIHSATWGGGVEIAALGSDYYARRLVSARRVRMEQAEAE